MLYPQCPNLSLWIQLDKEEQGIECGAIKLGVRHSCTLQTDYGGAVSPVLR